MVYALAKTPASCKGSQLYRHHRSRYPDWEQFQIRMIVGTRPFTSGMYLQHEHS